MHFDQLRSRVMPRKWLYVLAAPCLVVATIVIGFEISNQPVRWVDTVFIGAAMFVGAFVLALIHSVLVQWNYRTVLKIASVGRFCVQCASALPEGTAGVDDSFQCESCGAVWRFSDRAPLQSEIVEVWEQL